ncbi:unnamed protein product [Darwinula stevensoni]|uniref:Myosin-IA n=1 Tax=Darwinula stevensoni TaxID=69355 RepID=A0A7R9AF70_9CRUS|nr:unnamed protein product [Darwinula stevensoni]CAG0902655.1 unnamed protein product [Darwinula stevensoni]
MGVAERTEFVPTKIPPRPFRGGGREFKDRSGMNDGGKLMLIACLWLYSLLGAGKSHRFFTGGSESLFYSPPAASTCPSPRRIPTLTCRTPIPRTELVLKQEQEEYRREGITWVHIEYFNNQIICDLVEEPHKGIISILDEACLSVGKVTDVLLLETMDQKLKGHQHYTSRRLNPQDKALSHGEQFRIKHYAGDVTYSIIGFLDKNKDSLFQDFKRLLYNSKDGILSSMWPEGAMDITKTTKRPQTAGTLFKNSMIALVKTLTSKEPHYIRCIKPNDQKSPVIFDPVRIEHQVRYLGLLENTRVRRAGYAYRQKYEKFLHRYKMLSHYTWPNYHAGPAKDGTKLLLEDRGVAHDVEYGKTKIFLRSPQTLFALEQSRSQLLPGIVMLLQKMWRGAIARKRYRRMLAVRRIIEAYRQYRMRKYILQLCKAFKDVKRTRDFGKSTRWPIPPKVLETGVKYLKVIHRRWWAAMILARVPKQDLPQMRIKIAAADALVGKRTSWGFHRDWKGNYLGMISFNSNSGTFTSSVSSLRSKDPFSEILFSCMVRKVNKHNKSADRAILITDTAIFKLNPKNFRAMKSGIPLNMVTGMTVTPGGEQLVIMHVKGGNDFVLSLQSPVNEDLVGEAVGVLRNAFRRKMGGAELPVGVSARPGCSLGNKARNITVEGDAPASKGIPVFRKGAGKTILYSPPASAQ